jgi:hypothetical protein
LDEGNYVLNEIAQWLDFEVSVLVSNSKLKRKASSKKMHTTNWRQDKGSKVFIFIKYFFKFLKILRNYFDLCPKYSSILK